MVSGSQPWVNYEEYEAVYFRKLWELTFLKIAHPNLNVKKLLEKKNQLVRAGADLAGRCASLLGNHVRTGGENENMNTKNLLLDEKYYMEQVQLPPHEVERLTGVKKRKLRYWTQKGYLKSKIEDGYRYGFREVRKAALMDKHVAGGLSLEAAKERAEEILNKAETGREEVDEISREEFQALPHEAFKDLELEELRETFKNVAKSVVKSPEIKKALIEDLKEELSSNGDEPDNEK